MSDTNAMNSSSNLDGSSNDANADISARSSTPAQMGQKTSSSDSSLPQPQDRSGPNGASLRRDSVLGKPQAEPQGKTARLAPRKTPGAEGLSGSSGIDPDIPSTNDKQKVTLKEVDYTLITVVNASRDPKNSCTTNVHAEFFLLPSGFHGDKVPHGTKPAGFLYAHIVDKTILNPKDSQPAWVPELLAIWKQLDRPLQHPLQGARLTELQATLKHIHAKTGAPRPEFDAHRNALMKDKVHVVTAFACERDYWGTGLAQVAMAGYERAMLQLKQAAGLQTMILSPAPLSDALAREEKPHSGREIENRLIKSYEKSGYTLWSRQPAIITSGFIIMAKTLTLVVEDDSDDEPLMKRWEARAAKAKGTSRRAVLQGNRPPVQSRPASSIRSPPSGPAAPPPSPASPDTTATLPAAQALAVMPHSPSSWDVDTQQDRDGRKSAQPFQARTIFAEDATRYLTEIEPMTWVQKHRVPEAVIARWETWKRNLASRQGTE